MLLTARRAVDRCDRSRRDRRCDAGRCGPVRARRTVRPNCTAADLASVASGVSAATSAYLFTHPDVNDFFTGLEGEPRDTRPGPR